MQGESLPFPAVGADAWPGIEPRFTAAWRNLRTVEIIVTAGENAPKGWISALGDRYRNQHALDELIAIVRRHPTEDNARAGESLTWLTDYAVKFQYEGASAEMADPTGLREEVSDPGRVIRERVVALTGRENVPQPLGGQ